MDKDEQIKELAREVKVLKHKRLLTRCPSCHNDTLFINDNGWLTCSWLKCMNPLAINQAEQLERQLADERWMHAACLTIAETGQKWGENVKPSLAMETVYRLYHRLAEAQQRSAELEAKLSNLMIQYHDKVGDVPHDD